MTVFDSTSASILAPLSRTIAFGVISMTSEILEVHMDNGVEPKLVRRGYVALGVAAKISNPGKIDPNTWHTNSTWILYDNAALDDANEQHVYMTRLVASARISC